MSGWQSLLSPPENHIGVILAFRWGEGVVVGFGFRDGRRYFADPRGLGVSKMIAVEATHWQPMPELPPAGDADVPR